MKHLLASERCRSARQACKGFYHHRRKLSRTEPKVYEEEMQLSLTTSYVLNTTRTKAQHEASGENTHGSRSRKTNLTLVSRCIVGAKAAHCGDARRKILEKLPSLMTTTGMHR